MKVLFNNKWIPHVLDYCFPNELDSKNVKVLKYFILDKVEEQYIDFPSLSYKVWKAYNYIWLYGLADTLVKIRSRLNELIRNDKYLCCGYGLVDAKAVFFIAPNHQYGHDFLVLPAALIFNANFNLDESCKVYDLRALELLYFKCFKGFSFYSGHALDFTAAIPDIKKFELYINELNVEKFLVNTSELSDKAKAESAFQLKNKKSSRKEMLNAVLFGYGNYAKTIIIPNFFRGNIILNKIHEIDPVQTLGLDKIIELSTDALPDINSNYKVWVIAGYHHLHTDLAIACLKQNAYAVIEKPLATTSQQFQDFENYVIKNKSNFFLGFQKRYSDYNQYIFADLKINKGDRFNYYAVVYEETLGSNHWYNWPNSQTRIISNGCHWIDHFLFLNNYIPVESYAAEYLDNQDLIIKITLQNQSSFVLLITNFGSKRLGVREHIRISINNITIEITDNKLYKAENNFKTIRQKRYTSKLHDLKAMYKQINALITANEAGDSLESLQSSFICIKLNEALKNKLKFAECIK